MPPNDSVAHAQRYRGPGIVDTVPAIGVGKTISAPANGSSPDLSIAKRELDAIAYIAGGAWISSQGRVKFVPFFDASVDPVSGLVTYMPHQAAHVAIIPREEIAEPISVTPGYKYRVPLFDVWWGWNEATQSWGARAPDGTVSGGGEVHGVSLSALNALGQARLVANRQLADHIAKWIPSQGLAQGLAQRQVQTLGLGQLAWRFRTTYAHPELELGDPITLETDRFIAYDPTAAKGIAGAQWVTGYVVGIFDVWGRDLAVWVPTYASIGVGEVQVSSAPPAPNPSTCTVTVQATARAGGMLVVSWAGSPTVASVRVAWTTAAALAPAGPLGAPVEQAALGGASSLLGLPGSSLQAQPSEVAAGAPSRLSGAAGPSGPPPAGAGTVLPGQSGQTPLGPFAFSDLVYVTVTPYATIDGTGAPGPAVSTQVRMFSDPGEHDPGTGLRPRYQPFHDGQFALKASDAAGRETTDHIYIDPTKTIKVGTAANPLSITKTLTIPFGELVPGSDTTKWLVFTTGYVTANVLNATQTLWASVVLPRGVTITAIRAKVYRNAAGDAAVITFFRSTSTSATPLASLTAATGGWTTQSASISDLVGSEEYYLEVDLTGTVSIADARFAWFELDYTMPDYSKSY